MRRLAPVLLLLALAGCDKPPPDGVFQGYVDAEYLRIAAPEAGWVASVDVTKGAQVAAGASLFTLDSDLQRAAVAQARATLDKAESDLADLLKGARPEEIASIEAQLAEAEAALDLARIQFRRQDQLARTRVASEQALDQARATAEQAEAQRNRIRADLATARLPAREDRIASARAAVNAARAALVQAEWHLTQRNVTSPAAGVIDDVLRRPGEWVPTSGTVISLLPPEAVKVVFFVPEARRAAFRPGDTVAVDCSGCPQDLTARISRVAQEAEYTPPVIYSRETRAKLVWRMEAILTPLPGAPTPGQPVSVRARP
ncbi:HlyD family efflux transporter periplasmic adaptor subunit [Roseomonas sp. JC162]|uniref:HlyD family efflux transporter periplasmic adaptor subunit n=1 Tax=Neoroseomonas marina TaxID=1232220 RepID=A0A848EBZ6_9PROT|nr:HlyD family efflux transporter periplasmic adaptor subunit [Neoroseomonas marina]NMJ42054.1 HlyD family efflux transporter periplasmic adaptor subunit [Neoroseomonas marina]